MPRKLNANTKARNVTYEQPDLPAIVTPDEDEDLDEAIVLARREEAKRKREAKQLKKARTSGEGPNAPRLKKLPYAAAQSQLSPEEKKLRLLMRADEVHKQREVQSLDQRTGEMRTVTPAEQLERRTLAFMMVADFRTHPEIHHELYNRFGMADAARRNLISRAHQELCKTDTGEKQFAKSSAVHRHLRWVRLAAGAKQFSAVASLERNLARIQGTLEPLEVNLTLDANVKMSVTNVVASLDADTLRKLAERALQYRGEMSLALPSPESSAPALEPDKTIIDMPQLEASTAAE